MTDPYDPKSSDPANVLRKIATEIDDLTDLSGYRPNTEWLRKAADEIESLRARIADLEVEADSAEHSGGYGV